jgi:GNAT superfamily N-acetyltransferase
LHAADEPALLELTAGSDLPSLAEAASVRRLLREGVVVGAVTDGRLVGCACIARDVSKRYVDHHGQRAALPLPNTYLCGAFVAADARGAGIGSRLYATRLALAPATRPVVVELLGTGAPWSVHPETRAGYRFHLRAGFAVIGYSVDADRGAVLRRDPDHPEVPS